MKAGNAACQECWRDSTEVACNWGEKGTAVEHPGGALERAEDALEEAKQALGCRRAGWACFKLYEAVANLVKHLAERYRLPEAGKARSKGWATYLLSRASKSLARILEKPELDAAWCKAYDFYIHGFLARALEPEHVEPFVPLVEELVRIAGRRGEECGRKMNAGWEGTV